MEPAVLLWDFGDTLVDERWMWRAPEACPSWPDAWAATMIDHAADWDTGRIDERVVVESLAARTGLSVEHVERHFATCCADVDFHPVAWACAREHRRPQALVTVNPDLFRTRIVPAYDLSTVFDAIVVSSEEGVDDKTRLCDEALDSLGFSGDRRLALLIDNRADVVAAWRAAGGAGYCYEGDAAFAAAWRHLFQLA